MTQRPLRGPSRGDPAPLCAQGKLSRSTSPRLPDEIMLQYTYPRLDIEVTKGLNHLLKAPFCVHPKTGRVCVPIDPRAADKFDPITVPTVR